MVGVRNKPCLLVSYSVLRRCYKNTMKKYNNNTILGMTYICACVLLHGVTIEKGVSPEGSYVGNTTCNPFIASNDGGLVNLFKLGLKSILFPNHVFQTGCFCSNPQSRPLHMDIKNPCAEGEYVTKQLRLKFSSLARWSSAHHFSPVISLMAPTTGA